VEWDTLNNRDSLSTDNIIAVIQKLHKAGVTQILFSGGEPLNRIKDLGEILDRAPKDIDYWIFTNGYSMSENKARFLKAHGLAGVIVSVDHTTSEWHDRFRGIPGSFNKAIDAIRSVNEAGMLSAMSCCATNEFITRKNLRDYIELARVHGVSFVQFLEPEAAGRYRGLDVSLTLENQHLLESLHNEVNFTSAYRDYPLITYYPYLKRLNGCVARGINFLYIDAEGDVHPCPFCRSKRFSILKEDLPSNLEELRSGSCSSISSYKNVTNPDIKTLPGQVLQSVPVQFPQHEKYHI
jgi:MoaA/NifB/PqqE/SkfB family radical SAM enzyme